MLEIIINKPDFDTFLETELYNLYIQQIGVDYVIYCADNGQVKCHSTVLMAHSAEFQKITKKTNAVNSFHFTNTNEPKEIVKKFLELVYLQRVRGTIDEIRGLRRLAEHFSIKCFLNNEYRSLEARDGVSGTSADGQGEPLLMEENDTQIFTPQPNQSCAEEDVILLENDFQNIETEARVSRTSVRTSQKNDTQALTPEGKDSCVIVEEDISLIEVNDSLENKSQCNSNSSLVFPCDGEKLNFPSDRDENLFSDDDNFINANIPVVCDESSNETVVLNQDARGAISDVNLKALQLDEETSSDELHMPKKKFNSGKNVRNQNNENSPSPSPSRGKLVINPCGKKLFQKRKLDPNSSPFTIRNQIKRKLYIVLNRK